MHDASLFGHLAARFSASPENLATESLRYILDRSPVANRAFLRGLARCGVALPARLHFATQVGGVDGAIPDLVGTDEAGRPILIAEAKFWAGLTDNQPLAYLRRLPPDADTLLLILAPALRFATLWPELARRCRGAGIPFGAAESGGAEWLSATVGPGQRVAAAGV